MQCPTCQTELPDTHPATLVTLFKEFIAKNGGWEVFETRFTKGMRFNFGPGASHYAEVVDSKTSYATGDIDYDAGWYDGLPQGTQFETYIVVKIGDNYFKKTGTGDSYGEVTWDGELVNVTPREKKIVIWE